MISSVMKTLEQAVNGASLTFKNHLFAAISVNWSHSEILADTYKRIGLPISPMEVNLLLASPLMAKFFPEQEEMLRKVANVTKIVIATSLLYSFYCQGKKREACGLITGFAIQSGIDYSSALSPENKRNLTAIFAAVGYIPIIYLLCDSNP